MILFKVLNSPDKHAIGEWKFFFDVIEIGQKTNFMGIDDDSIKETILKLEYLAEHLYISLSKGNKYTLNGKYASHRQALNKQDVVEIGKTKIAIVDFSKNPENDIDTEVDENLRKIVRGDHVLVDIINKVEEDLR